MVSYQVSQGDYIQHLPADWNTERGRENVAAAKENLCTKYYGGEEGSFSITKSGIEYFREHVEEKSKIYKK